MPPAWTQTIQVPAERYRLPQLSTLDDHDEGDDCVGIDVELESHDDVKRIAKAWRDLHGDFEDRTEVRHLGSTQGV